MKTGAIKDLLIHDEQTLKAAEDALINEKNPSIEVEGDDEGEKLSHILAALWIKEQKEMDEKEALRAFFRRVRTSIS